MLIVTDNGSNIVKAIKLLNARAIQDKQEATASREAEASEFDRGANDDAIVDSSDEDELIDSNDDDNSLDCDTEPDDHDSNTDEDEDVAEENDVVSYDTPYPCMPCMAHTLQLAIKKAYLFIIG